MQGIWHLTSEHDTDPRLRQIREMAAEALRSTNHTDVMEYPSSQRRDVVMPTRPPTSIRLGVPGVRVGGHGYTRQVRLSQPQPEYAEPEPEPLSPDDPPGWSVYTGSQSQLSDASYEHSQWGTRLSCDSFFGGGPDWDAARARRDPYFQNYQFVAPMEEEEGGEEEGGEEDGGNEEGGDQEGGDEAVGGDSGSGEEDEDVISRPPTEGSSRPAAKSSSSKFGKVMHNVFRGLSTRKNKGQAAPKYTPSGK